MKIEDLKNTYSGKKILLTGHTGFKGAWMLSILNLLGAKITGYALAPEDSSLYQDIKGDSLCQSIIGDIRDLKNLDQAILDSQPDYIFHLAAQALVLPSYEDPLYSFEVNTLGTVNLLESLRKLDKECHVVIITTDKVYRNLESDKAYKEDDKLGGHDPYSGSKAAAEIVVDSYIRSFFSKENSRIKVSTARAGNVIGGGDWAAHRIVPDIIRALRDNESIILRNPESIRPWQHVLEPIYGYLLLAMMMSQSNSQWAYNFGPDQNEKITVKQLTKHALEIWGAGSFEIAQSAAKVHESKLLVLDSSKAKKDLNWHPKLSQTDSIDWTINWYKKAIKDNINPLRLIQMDATNFFLQTERK